MAPRSVLKPKSVHGSVQSRQMDRDGELEIADCSPKFGLCVRVRVCELYHTACVSHNTRKCSNLVFASHLTQVAAAAAAAVAVRALRRRIRTRSAHLAAAPQPVRTRFRRPHRRITPERSFRCAGSPIFNGEPSGASRRSMRLHLPGYVHLFARCLQCAQFA